MPRVRFITATGNARDAAVPVGWSMMEGAVKNGVPGIEADCGGTCACATCHVYVDVEWLPKLPPPNDAESGMLDFAQGRHRNSRLSCQIKMTEALDGITVTIPESQY